MTEAEINQLTADMRKEPRKLTFENQPDPIMEMLDKMKNGGFKRVVKVRRTLYDDNDGKMGGATVWMYNKGSKMDIQIQEALDLLPKNKFINIHIGDKKYFIYNG